MSRLCNIYSLMSSTKETVSAFSSSSQDAMTHPLDVIPDPTADNLPQDEFNAYYEIEETAEEIIRNDYKRVPPQLVIEIPAYLNSLHVDRAAISRRIASQFCARLSRTERAHWWRA